MYAAMLPDIKIINGASVSSLLVLNFVKGGFVCSCVCQQDYIKTTSPIYTKLGFKDCR